VGSSGHVLATDIDTRFLEGLKYANLEVRRHDVVNEALPESAFDLVHSRMVLTHIPERERVMRSMVGALKPGAWLVVEEVDTATWLPDPRVDGASLFSQGITAFGQVQADAGVDESYGRRLYATRLLLA
jgi:chemotaxis methyl-accepting protein methylase